MEKEKDLEIDIDGDDDNDSGSENKIITHKIEVACHHHSTLGMFIVLFIGLLSLIACIYSCSYPKIIYNYINDIRIYPNVYVSRPKFNIGPFEFGKESVKVQIIIPDKSSKVCYFDLDDIRFMQCSTNQWVRDIGNKLYKEIK